FSPNQKRKLKQGTLASPPPPQGLPPSVTLRHYHHRLVVRASSSFKNHSFFFIELGASVSGIHLLHRAPAAVCRALSHHRLRLVVADSSNPPPSSELCSSPGLCLRHDSAPLFSDCSEEKPISIPVFFFRVQRAEPAAIIFSDAGPDTRWVGNELGLDASTCWSIYNSTLTPIGGIYNDPRYAAEGDPAGHEWVPALYDVSIRPDMVKNKGFLPSGRSEIHKQRNQIKAIINSLLPACNSADPHTHVAFNADAIIANLPAYATYPLSAIQHFRKCRAYSCCWFLKVPLHIFFIMPWTPTYEFPHPLSRVKQQMAYR
ncbi:hypothetical protein S245_055888, partial [Arachis hypogaea]